MTVAELLGSVRRRLRDSYVSADQRLWEDAELIDDYANAARDRLFLITRKMVIDSTTPETCQIAIKAGQAAYPLSPKVIEVQRVRLASHTTPSMKVTASVLDTFCPGWEDLESNSSWSAWCPDLGTDTITFIPKPPADDTALLTVSRYPLTRLASTDSTADLGFREEYNEDIIPWILHLAFSKKDAETDRPDLAKFQREVFLTRAEEIKLELHRRYSDQHTISPRRAFLSR